MNRNNSLKMALIGCGLAGMQAAGAVSLSADGIGQVLLFPYYTTRAGHDTVLSLVNSTTAGKAVRLRFREGRNSRVVLDLNLYLGANMSWSAAVTSDGGGNPVLRSYEAACTAPLLGADPANPAARQRAFSNEAYANHDMAGNSLDRAKEGFFEVIEMGEVNKEFVLSSGENLFDAITYAAITETPASTFTTGLACAAVAAAWETSGSFLASNGQELGPPKGGLHGAAMIINIGDGTTYPFQPVALDAVYSAGHHAAPGSASPSLADADPSSTVLVDGVVTTSAWTQGIDAVSAVLTHTKAYNDYAFSPESAAVATDLVLTFPTKGFYVARESDGEATRAPFTAQFDDRDQTGSPLADGASTGACEPVVDARYARNGEWNTAVTLFQRTTNEVPTMACWSSTIVSVGRVLSSSNTAPPNVDTIGGSSPARNSGRIDVSFGANRELVSVEGRAYVGLPVIGFAARRYISAIGGGVLANYGVNQPHRYETLVR